MFKLLRQMSLDAIDQMYEEEECEELPDSSLVQTVSNFENDISSSSRQQERPSGNFASRRTPLRNSQEIAFNTSADTSIQEK